MTVRCQLASIQWQHGHSVFADSVPVQSRMRVMSPGGDFILGRRVKFVPTPFLPERWDEPTPARAKFDLLILLATLFIHHSVLGRL